MLDNKRNILITNDDGISSDGLYRLAKTACKFGKVWIVAPDGERSAMSHSITLRSFIDVFPVQYEIDNVKAFKCSGTPADCVRVGVLNILPQKPDVILSGINFGYNSASDIQYSATVGAALEGNFQGIHSIALSEGACECHEVTDKYLEEILSLLIKKPFIPGEIWNVNFPSCKIENCKGFLWDRKVSPRGFYKDEYTQETLENGVIRLKVNGIYSEDADPDTDFRAIVDNYISIGMVNNLN